MTSSGPRSRALAFAALALGSLAGLLLASQHWWTLPATAAGVTGNEATDSLAGVLAGAAAAGTALAGLSGRWARTLLGAAIALIATAMVVAVLIAESQPVTGGLTESFAEPPQATGLAVAYLACAVLTGAGALVLALFARSWPVRPDRFARTTGRASVTATDDAADVWRALDAGFDPTVGDNTSDADRGTGRKARNRGE